MRIAVALLVLLIAGSAWADDGDLLNRFKQQNERGREQLKAELKGLLEKVQALEKDEPAEALRLLQEARDRMLAKGQLIGRADRALAEPLWERIVTLRRVTRGQAAAELRAGLADYKEYLSRLNEQFALLRVALVPPGKAVPPGEPAFIAYQNGKTAIAWLNQAPVYSVNCQINDQPTMLSPGFVTGVQTATAFYLHDPASKRFVRMTPTEFFVTAVAAYSPARRAGFWIPRQAVTLPPGYDRRSAGGEGVALFGRTSAALMATWTRPNAHRPDIGAARANDPDLARLYRDVMIELKVQQMFAKLNSADRDRIRAATLAFLDQRTHNEPLSDEEIVRFSERIAETYPERRADAVAFGHLLNRVLEFRRATTK